MKTTLIKEHPHNHTHTHAHALYIYKGEFHPKTLHLLSYCLSIGCFIHARPTKHVYIYEYSTHQHCQQRQLSYHRKPPYDVYCTGSGRSRTQNVTPRKSCSIYKRDIIESLDCYFETDSDDPCSKFLSIHFSSSSSSSSFSFMSLISLSPATHRFDYALVLQDDIIIIIISTNLTRSTLMV